MKKINTKFNYLVLICMFFLNTNSYSQGVQIGLNIAQPHNSAILDLQSTNSGFLITRMTTQQRNAISNPAEALMIFNTTTKCLEIFVQDWQSIWCEVDTGLVCPDSVNDIDGNSYNIVQIGEQCWFIQNLKTTQYKNGASISYPGSNTSLWGNNTTGAYAWYNNDSATYAAIYGALYNWHAVMNHGGLCPDGWHVPSHDEWTTLERAVCTSASCNTDFPYDATTIGTTGTNEGAKLAGGFALWTPGNLINSTDFGTSGFDALPSGRRLNSFSANYYDLNSWGSYWTSTSYNNTDAWGRTFLYIYTLTSRGLHSKKDGYAVRCMKYL